MCFLWRRVLVEMELESDTIVVTGLGMVSPIGFDVITSCASARAGIVRASALDYFSTFDAEEASLETVIGQSLQGFSTGFVGLGRLIRLGSAALSDLFSYMECEARTLSSGCGLFLNLSSGYYPDRLELIEREKEGTLILDEDDPDYEPFESQIRQYQYGKSLIPRLCDNSDLKIDLEFQRVYFEDHVGIITAIKDAALLLRSGKLERCIVGGIDSYVDHEMLEVLASLKLLKSADNPVGITPGEASAFFMLERYDVAKRRNAKIEAYVDYPCIIEEEVHRFSDTPCGGQGLSSTISQTYGEASKSERPIGTVIFNLNGDPWKSSEWGNTIAHVSLSHPITEAEYWYPAESFSETGAATASISLCFGVRSFIRRHFHENVLLAMSNDNGKKGAVFLGRC